MKHFLQLAALAGALLALFQPGTAMAQSDTSERDALFGVYMSARAETPCGRGTPARDEDCPIKPVAIQAKVDMDKDPQADPGLQCEPARLVRMFTWFPRPMEFIKGDNEIIMRYENMGVIRTVHMNDQPAPPESWKSIHGFSRGHWEGNTLVIETTNLLGNWWVLPNSDKTRTIERYWLTEDGSGLNLQVQVFDDEYYDEPYFLEPAVFTHMPDGYIGDYECSVQTEDLFYGDDIDSFFD